MISKNIELIEGLKHELRFILTGVDDVGDFEPFGYVSPLGCNHQSWKIEKVDESYFIPALKNGIYNCQIFIKQLSTNKDFLALEGKIEVKNSLMTENNSSLGGTELELTFDANTTEIHCEIGQGLRGEKGDKGDKGDNGEDGNEVTVDLTFSATSENAQSGKAVAQATANCLKNDGSLGGLIGISDWHYCQTRMGYSSHSASAYCTAIGANTQAHYYSTALGYNAKAAVGGTMALGANITVKDTGVAAIAVNNKANAADADNLQTILYIISEGSDLATKYEDGEACLGYVVKDKNGNISACGTRKLSELLTNNTAFAPAMLDLDAPTPTPFMPTGITDPIEIPEEITEEQ